MDKFQQINTELWLLIDVINWFSLSTFGISLLIFFKLYMKRSSFKMIFFSLKISGGGVCCMPAALYSLSHDIVVCSLIYLPCSVTYITNNMDPDQGAQWLSGRVLSGDRGVEGLSLINVTVLCP